MFIENTVFVFIYSLLPFLIQLFVCEALFVYKLPRRDFFAARLIAGLPTLVALAFLIACLLTVVADNVVGSTIIYLIIFMMSVLLVWTCFDAPFKTILLFSVAAYAMQNTIYRVMSIFELTGVVWQLVTVLNDYFWGYHLILIGIFAVVGVGVYFLYVRRIISNGPEHIYNLNVLIISMVTLTVTLLLCSFTNIWWYRSIELSAIVYCFTILSNTLILTIISGMFESSGLKNEIETVRQLWGQDKRQYELSKENIDLINIKCHDLKHKIHALRDGTVTTDEELGEIEQAVAIYDCHAHTGCNPIDVLITEKSLVCAKQSIKLNYMVDGRGLLFMSESELYSLFGNMLTNAVNAVCNLADIDKRVINLTVSRMADMVFINCVNYYDGVIKIVDELPQTSGDRSVHGFGMKSMRLLVKKHGGEMMFTADDGVFDLKIMLPEKRSPKQEQVAAAA